MNNEMNLITIMIVRRSRRCLLNNYKESERGESLCQLDWELHINEEGVVTEVPQLLHKIFRGGVDDNIK